MKVLFAGPSLAGATPSFEGLVVRPPARQGDILLAVEAGARAIGLIDGYFEQSGSVWHKEILFALSSGVWVLGASSMGALRAAECAVFGMIPVGVVANAYASGLLVDDADVALLSGPLELGSPHFTEPLVNVFATIERLGLLGLVDDDRIDRLHTRARDLHFSERTVEAVCQAVPDCAAALKNLYETHRVDVKRSDALTLVDTLRLLDTKAPFHATWDFVATPHWREMVATLRIQEGCSVHPQRPPGEIR